MDKPATPQKGPYKIKVEEITETIANKGAVAAEILLGPMVRWRARGQWNGHEAES